MAVSDEQVEELRRAYAARPPEIAVDDPLRRLDDWATIIAYVITLARAQGRDEVDDVELLVLASSCTKVELRESAHVLAPLGFDKVVARLRELVRAAPR